MTQDPTNKLTAAEAALSEARTAHEKATRAAADAGPEEILAARKAARAAAEKITDLEAVVAAWRTKVSEAEKNEKRSRLPAAIAAADPAPVRKALEPIAAELLKCKARIAHLENEARTAIARQGLLAADAEALGRECGESVAIDRLAPRYFDALLLVTSALEKPVPNLCERVLVALGDSSPFYLRSNDLRDAGIEEQEAIAMALDGSLWPRLAEATAVKKAADDAARAARKVAETEYQSASDNFPWGTTRLATPAQRTRLEAAELALFGKDKASKLREARGSVAPALNEQAAE